jgi:hypothetical protein
MSNHPYPFTPFYTPCNQCSDWYIHRHDICPQCSRCQVICCVCVTEDKYQCECTTNGIPIQNWCFQSKCCKRCCQTCIRSEEERSEKENRPPTLPKRKRIQCNPPLQHNNNTSSKKSTHFSFRKQFRPSPIITDMSKLSTTFTMNRNENKMEIKNEIKDENENTFGISPLNISIADTVVIEQSTPPSTRSRRCVDCYQSISFGFRCLPCNVGIPRPELFRYENECNRVGLVKLRSDAIFPSYSLMKEYSVYLPHLIECVSFEPWSNLSIPLGISFKLPSHLRVIASSQLDFDPNNTSQWIHIHKQIFRSGQEIRVNIINNSSQFKTLKGGDLICKIQFISTVSLYEEPYTGVFAQHPTHIPPLQTALSVLQEQVKHCNEIRNKSSTIRFSGGQVNVENQLGFQPKLKETIDLTNEIETKCKESVLMNNEDQNETKEEVTCDCGTQGVVCPRHGIPPYFSYSCEEDDFLVEDSQKTEYEDDN